MLILAYLSTSSGNMKTSRIQAFRPVHFECVRFHSPIWVPRWHLRLGVEFHPIRRVLHPDLPNHFPTECHQWSGVGIRDRSNGFEDSFSFEWKWKGLQQRLRLKLFVGFKGEFKTNLMEWIFSCEFCNHYFKS